MVGTVGSLGLSQRVGSDGLPLAGWKLYVYAATTSTPATTYKDYGLTAGLEHPHPILADANGMMPMWWVADGSYRVRGIDTTGATILFDEDSVRALGPSSGAGGGGGVSATAIFATGDVLWNPVTGTRTGWVRCNARTIGSATSGASERANADCEALFLHLHGTYSDTLCPVSTGRGASAAADWAANKTIGTLDLRGRSPIGVSDMGNSDSTILDSVTFTVGSKTAAASRTGAARKTLTTTELPAHTHSITDAGHTHNALGVNNSANSTTIFALAAGATIYRNATPDTNLLAGTIASATTGISATNSSGTGSAFDNLSPVVTGSWYVKL